MPAPEEIRQSGLRSEKVRECDSDEIWLTDTVGNIWGPGERIPKEVRGSEFVQMGEGLLPMWRRLVDKIEAGDFIDRIYRVPSVRRGWGGGGTGGGHGLQTKTWETGWW